MVRRIPSARVLVPRVLILAGLALCGSALRADVIAGNILGGDAPYSNEGAVPVSNNTDDFTVAQEFSVTGGNYDLSGIQFVVGSSDDPSEIHTINLGIFTDVSDEPGVLLEPLLTYTGTVAPFNGDLAPILNVDSVNNPELFAGNNYWLVMSGPADESLQWYQNLDNASGILTTDGISSTWIQSDSTQGAFEVDGTLVQGSDTAPEPGTWILLIAGIGTMGVLRQARR